MDTLEVKEGKAIRICIGIVFAPALRVESLRERARLCLRCMYKCPKTLTAINPARVRLTIYSSRRARKRQYLIVEEG